MDDTTNPVGGNPMPGMPPMGGNDDSTEPSTDMPTPETPAEPAQ